MLASRVLHWILTLAWLPRLHGKVTPTRMSSRTVQTEYGPLRGILVTLPNSHLGNVEAYLGLQYASLLKGDLRFMPPTSPMEKWDSPQVAMKFKPVCPQRLPDLAALQHKMPLGRVDHFERLIPFLKDQAEECLYLNVYVPTGEPIFKKKLTNCLISTTSKQLIMFNMRMPCKFGDTHYFYAIACAPITSLGTC